MSNLFFTPILNPPLGSTSTRSYGVPIRFYACMQVTAANTAVISPDERFTVLLWYSNNGRGTWRPASFREVSKEEDIVQLLDLQKGPFKDATVPDSKTNPIRRDLFILDLNYDVPDRGPLQFCLKYRFSDGPWLWTGSRIGAADGRIVFRGTSPLPFTSLFDPSLNPNSWHSQLVADSTWDVTYTAVGVSPTDTLGVPLGRPQHLEHWMALVKIASPWMGPVHGTTAFNTNKDALMLLFQRTDAKHVVVLPVSAQGNGSTYITSDEESRGEVMVISRDDGEDRGEVRKVQVIVSVGDTPRETVAAAMGYLRGLVMGGKGPVEGVKEGKSRRMWEDGVSYCTWNGLGWDLSEGRIVGALEQLENAGVKVCNLMIDDNWQTLSSRNYGSSGTWSSFEANDSFPGGLKTLVSNIREKFPYIKHIGVWHALHGYWDGITPKSVLGREYKTVEVAWRDNVNSVDRMLTMVAPEDVGRFYDDFYKFLVECGVDSVKTDVQCRIDELTHGGDKARLARAYQDAFRESSIKYFDQRVIYCMAHVPQILYHALLPDDDKPVFFRTSDDFYPNVPQSHAWHVFANAMNMVLFSHLNILPDWDMFQSSLPTYNSLHAAARCLSGGPIFITDTPSEHDASLIASMASPSPAQRTPRALRPSGMAVAGDPYTGYHSNRLLQIQNTSRANSLLGIFNVSTVALTELVDVKNVFLGFEKEKEYVVRAYVTGRVTEVAEGDSMLVVGLEPGAWEVFTAAPVEKVGGLKVAALGLKENITGVAAVAGGRVYTGVDGRIVVVQVELCALGVLVVYVDDIVKGRVKEDVSVRIGGRNVSEEYYAFPGCGDATLEVDVLRAWEDMAFGAEHGGEDEVMISIELA